VLPVQIDVISTQAAQRVVDLLHDGLAAGAPAVGVAGEHVAGELGRDHEPVTQARVVGEVSADDFFGPAVGVGVGGIQGVAARV
jgi:hypothetical protein